MDELAAPAIEVVERDEVRIVPESYKRVYLDWMRNIRPWCISRQLWWGHRLPVWYGPGGEEVVAESEALAREAAAERGLDPDALRQETDVLDTWFSSALWPFATLGWPDDDPLLRAFYPTSFLTTARDIIFLWVARMVMMGIEFAGDVPFRDVYVHPVIQAPDGRRMSKSLGTGIDPLDEIEVHGADALRFGLLAMSSTQDVRYSADRVQQGRDLANKMWNASRLILLNADEPSPEPRTEAIEDRWILSRLQQRDRVGDRERSTSYDFSHAVLDFYDFFWSEFCDWYLEIVKPRLYDGDEDAAANLLFVLERVLALAHPVMPFVTEEIWSYLPDREDLLVVSEFPRRDPSLVDTEAALAVRARDRRESARSGAGATWSACRPARVLEARIVDGESPSSSPAWRGSLDERRDDEPLATIGPIEILASAESTREQVERGSRPSARRLRGEIERGERKLANEGFVAKAPAEVVEAEREKLDGYRRELDARLTLAWTARRRGLPRLARAARDAVRARADPQAGLGAGHAAAPVRLRARGRHQRQVVGDRDDRGAARGARDQRRRLPLAARRALVGADPDPRRGDRARRVRRPRSSGSPRRVEAVNRTLDEGESVTQFEADTAAAFVALAAAGVEAAVIEAGLGGRLDATNVLPSRVTVLTSIGLEHTEWLGETELEIAAEKLAVLRDHTTLVLGPVSRRGRGAGARDRGASATARSSPSATSRPRSSSPIAAPPTCAATSPSPWPPPRACSARSIRERVAEVAAGLDLHGRMETIEGDPPLILDAAHNPPARGRWPRRCRRSAAGGRWSPASRCSPTRTPRASSPRWHRRSTAWWRPRSRRERLASAGTARGAGAGGERAGGGGARGRESGWVGEEPDPVAAIARARAEAARARRRGARHRLALPAPLREPVSREWRVVRYSEESANAHPYPARRAQSRASACGTRARPSRASRCGRCASPGGP